MVDMDNEVKKKLAQVTVQIPGHLIIIVPGKEGVRNDFEIKYGIRCLWIYTDKKIVDVVPFENIEFINFTWKLEEKKEGSKECPRCKGEGVIEFYVRMGDDGDVDHDHCPKCKGTGVI